MPFALLLFSRVDFLKPAGLVSTISFHSGSGWGQAVKQFVVYFELERAFLLLFSSILTASHFVMVGNTITFLVFGDSNVSIAACHH